MGLVWHASHKKTKGKVNKLRQLSICCFHCINARENVRASLNLPDKTCYEQREHKRERTNLETQTGQHVSLRWQRLKSQPRREASARSTITTDTLATEVVVPSSSAKETSKGSTKQVARVPTCDLHHTKEPKKCSAVREIQYRDQCGCTKLVRDQSKEMPKLRQTQLVNLFAKNRRDAPAARRHVHEQHSKTENGQSELARGQAQKMSPGQAA